MPTLIMPDDAQTPATNLLLTMNPAMNIAATEMGPNMPDSGGTNYVDDPGKLIEGIDALGKLGTIWWDRSTEEPPIYHGAESSDGGSRSADGVVVGGSTPPPAGSQYSFTLQGGQVDESWLLGGTQNASVTDYSTLAALNASESFTLTTDDAAKLLVDGVLVNWNGGDTATAITTAHGELNFAKTDHGDGSTTITYTYTLKNNFASHSENATTVPAAGGTYTGAADTNASAASTTNHWDEGTALDGAGTKTPAGDFFTFSLQGTDPWEQDITIGIADDGLSTPAANSGSMAPTDTVTDRQITLPHGADEGIVLQRVSLNGITVTLVDTDAATGFQGNALAGQSLYILADGTVSAAQPAPGTDTLGCFTFDSTGKYRFTPDESVCAKLAADAAFTFDLVFMDKDGDTVSLQDGLAFTLNVTDVTTAAMPKITVEDLELYENALRAAASTEASGAVTLAGTTDSRLFFEEVVFSYNDGKGSKTLTFNAVGDASPIYFNGVQIGILTINSFDKGEVTYTFTLTSTLNNTQATTAKGSYTLQDTLGDLDFDVTATFRDELGNIFLVTAAANP